MEQSAYLAQFAYAVPFFRRLWDSMDSKAIGRMVWDFRLNLERETGIEPATNGLGSRYSTIELLPLQTELYLAESFQ